MAQPNEKRLKMLSILQIILLVLNVAQFIIIIHIILSWLINFNVLSLGSPIVGVNLGWHQSLWSNRCYPPRIRQFLPDLGGIDLAPLVALLAIFLCPSDHHHQQCSHVPLRALTRRRFLKQVFGFDGFRHRSGRDRGLCSQKAMTRFAADAHGRRRNPLCLPS